MRFRLIDKVSIYLIESNNCHITLLYLNFKNRTLSRYAYFFIINLTRFGFYLSIHLSISFKKLSCFLHFIL